MRHRLAALACIALAACSGEPQPTPSPTPSATPTPDKPKTLVPADLAALTLGAKIVGPRGPDVDSTFSADGQKLAEVTSYVACPEGTSECKPDAMPEGTVYTYVHQVTPADGVMSGTLFRTARAARGFANDVGYDQAQATKALGPDGRIDVSVDNGALVWRVIGGDGWKAGEPIIFYWQSTVPPAGPRDAYQFEADGATALGTGPFPPKQEPVDGAAAR